VEVKVEVREEEAWRRVLSIEVPAADVEREYERVARRVAKKVNLPGFRKGKVPVSVVRKSFKSELDAEFLESVVPKAFGRALDETGIDPVSEPKFEDLSYGEERPLSFTADFECRPELELAEYRGLAAEKQVPEVTDEHVDSVLEDFRKSRAELEDVSREAIDGDVLVVDYQAIDANEAPIEGRKVEGYSFEMGADQVVDAFEEALRGASPDDVRMASVEYPAEYPDALLAGTTQRYRIRVRQVREKRFPTLDDALVAAHTDRKTVDELKEKIREDLGQQADRAGVERLEQVLLEKVVDANPFEAPASLVDGLLDDFVERRKMDAARAGDDAEALDVDKLRTDNREAAARQVRRMLLIEMIAAKEKLEVTGEELRDRVGVLARMRGVPPKKLIEDLGGDRFLRGLSREMRDKKVLAFLVENAEITEKTVSARPRQEA
jgi:trigger factor